jgi:hypothetical protein
MLALKWFWRLVFDTIYMGLVNRSLLVSTGILLALLLGVMIAAVQVTAPYIYTLF